MVTYQALQSPLDDQEKKPLICVVCGSTARGFNFGAVTCMSCKVFFRRNAHLNLNHLFCNGNGRCQITPQTRKYCTFCRLLMCFRVGMRRELFRNKINNDQQQKPSIKYFFQWFNHSQLTHHDWNLVQQLISIFDSLTDRISIKSYEIHQQISSIGNQPLKMRVKTSYIYDLINVFHHATIELTRSISKFSLIPCVNMQILLSSNLRSVTMLYKYFYMNFEPILSLIQTSTWLTSIECLFSNEIREIYNQIKYSIDQIIHLDRNLIKLILIILIFSSSQQILTKHFNEQYHIHYLLKLQNIYTELLWKYMLYHFGSKRSVRLFSDLIKIILRIQIFLYSIETSRNLLEQKLNDYLI